VLKAVAEIFRDSTCSAETARRRDSSSSFLQHAGRRPLPEGIEERLGHVLAPVSPTIRPTTCTVIHVGIHDAEAAGLLLRRGPLVLRGVSPPSRCEPVAELSERYGSGVLRTTSMQNLLIPNVRRAGRAAGWRASFVTVACRWRPRRSGAGPWRARAPSSATGTHRDQKVRARPGGGARASASGLRPAPEDPRHRVPNSCGQHWIADLASKARRRSGRQARRCLYFCRRRRLWAPPGGGAAHRPAVPATDVAPGDRAPAPRLPCRRRTGENFRPVRPRVTPTRSSACSWPRSWWRPSRATSRRRARRTGRR